MSCQEFRDWAARNSGTAGIQGFRNSGAILQRIQGLGCQEFKGCAGIQELQEFLDSGTCAVRNSKTAGIQGLCRNSGIQEFKDSGIQGLSGIQEFKACAGRNSGAVVAGIQRLCRDSGIQGFRGCAGIQGFRGCLCSRESRAAVPSASISTDRGPSSV